MNIDPDLGFVWLKIGRKNTFHFFNQCFLGSDADPDPYPACHFDADADPTFHFYADPDPYFQIKTRNLEKF